MPVPLKLASFYDVLERGLRDAFWYATLLEKDVSVYWTGTDWQPGEYGCGDAGQYIYWHGGEGATYSRAKVDSMALAQLLQVSGLWNERITPDNIQAVRAFIQRPWGSRCNLDDICKQAAKYDVDPELLVKLAEAAEELNTETWGY